MSGTSQNGSVRGERGQPYRTLWAQRWRRHSYGPQCSSGGSWATARSPRCPWSGCHMGLWGGDQTSGARSVERPRGWGHAPPSASSTGGVISGAGRGQPTNMPPLPLGPGEDEVRSLPASHRPARRPSKTPGSAVPDHNSD